MKRILFLLPLLLLLTALPARAQLANARGWCEDGGQNVITSGLTSTTQVQASYTQCQISVSIHGGGTATIFSTGASAPLSNPFTAASNGQWIFYAANGEYDITLSGAGFPSPVTYSDVFIGGSGGGTITGSGAANQITVWTAPTAIGGSAALTSTSPGDINQTVPAIAGGQPLRNFSFTGASNFSALEAIIPLGLGADPSYDLEWSTDAGTDFAFFDLVGGVGGAVMGGNGAGVHSRVEAYDDGSVGLKTTGANEVKLPTTTGTAGQLLKTDGANPQQTSWFTVVRDFGTTFGDTTGPALTSGPVVYFTVPYACTIAAWNISVDAGTATLDIWKIATGTAIPTVANTITAAALPAIASGTSIHSTTLSGWTTAVAANDIFGLQLKTVATAKYVELDIQCNQ